MSLDGADGRFASALSLNAEAGSQRVTSDPVELAAAALAGERSIHRYPYLRERYGERGARFTRSDSGWLVTLAHQDRQDWVEGQVAWLQRVLSARGMPGVVLERHLVHLADELAAAIPERAAAYARLRGAAESLARARLAAVPDEPFRAVARAFDDAVGAEWSARLSNTGELLASAVADERGGVSGAVASLTGWLKDPARFPPAWIAAVDDAVRSARAAASHGPLARRPGPRVDPS